MRILEYSTYSVHICVYAHIQIYTYAHTCNEFRAAAQSTGGLVVRVLLASEAERLGVRSGMAVRNSGILAWIYE